MLHPNHADRAPVDPISTQTADALREAIYQMVYTPLREGRSIDRATMTFVSGDPSLQAPGFHTLDFDAERPDSIGSGQVVVADETLPEYVAWAKTESGIVSTFDYNGETFMPYGAISEISSDETNSSRMLSRFIIAMVSGRVLEVNEGEYLSEDKHTVRELGDGEVQALLATMSTVLSMPTLHKTA